MATPEEDRSNTLITLTADIVTAHVSNNSLSAQEVPALISSIYGALAGLGTASPPEEKLEPAVSIRSSVKADHIVCLEDGKKMKMLKRHLMTDHGLTPAEYRARWGLGADYPMVAPDYADKRRVLAKQIGLGRKPGQKPAPKAQAKKAASPRKKSRAVNGPSPAGK
jgi:predicted transcriptional regulator